MTVATDLDASTSAYHVTLAENLTSILREGLQPRIGERSAALGEDVPRVYLFPSREDCETALSSWLGECFEDVEEHGLLILAIDVDGLTLDSDVGYEMTTSDTIEPARIASVFREDWELMDTKAA
tara:strand:+ start:319 stop:693 length:375 start_codon:yes stop_codon:yes gene_type:complete